MEIGWHKFVQQVGPRFRQMGKTYWAGVLHGIAVGCLLGVWLGHNGHWFDWRLMLLVGLIVFTQAGNALLSASERTTSQNENSCN